MVNDQFQIGFWHPFGPHGQESPDSLSEENRGRLVRMAGLSGPFNTASRLKHGAEKFWRLEARPFLYSARTAKPLGIRDEKAHQAVQSIATNINSSTITNGDLSPQPSRFRILFGQAKRRSQRSSFKKFIPLRLSRRRERWNGFPNTVILRGPRVAFQHEAKP